MNTRILKPVVSLATAALLTCAWAGAAEEKAKTEPAKDTYPLTTCVVSGDKLGGGMGEPVKFNYNGREIRFCCQGCIAEFKKNPEKYLKILDAAAAARQKAAAVAPEAADKKEDKK